MLKFLLTILDDHSTIPAALWWRGDPGLFNCEIQAADAIGVVVTPVKTEAGERGTFRLIPWSDVSQISLLGDY